MGFLIILDHFLIILDPFLIILDHFLFIFDHILLIFDHLSSSFIIIMIIMGPFRAHYEGPTGLTPEGDGDHQHVRKEGRVALQKQMGQAPPMR